MTTETSTARILLWGMEASARLRFKEMHGRGWNVHEGTGFVDLTSGERFTVTARRVDSDYQYRYFYREIKNQMFSVIENRAVCLMALERRLGEVSR